MNVNTAIKLLDLRRSVSCLLSLKLDKKFADSHLGCWEWPAQRAGCPPPPGSPGTGTRGHQHRMATPRDCHCCGGCGLRRRRHPEAVHPCSRSRWGPSPLSRRSQADLALRHGGWRIEAPWWLPARGNSILRALKCDTEFISGINLVKVKWEWISIVPRPQTKPNNCRVLYFTRDGYKGYILDTEPL